MRLWFTYLKATLAMLFWSLTFVWFKIAFRSYRPYEITFLRLALAAGLLFAVMWLGKKREAIKGKDYLHLMLVAFCEPLCILSAKPMACSMFPQPWAA
jgi:drug/metabolite transporter (DMT)-like permease